MSMCCPVLVNFGAYADDEGFWVVRLSDRTVRLRLADTQGQELWQHLGRVCDGQTQMADVLAAYTESPVAGISPDAFKVLLDELLEAGVLHDAAQVLSNLASMGRPDALWGRAFSESDWPTQPALNHHDAEVRWVGDLNSPPDALPWHGLVKGRQSTYRFKNQGLSAPELRQLLQCYAAAEQKQAAVRRVVPSGGGLYQLKLWLLLLKPCEGFAVGVYKVSYRADGAVGLMEIHGLTATDLWQRTLRACTDPAALQHASAWLVVGADLKAIAKKYRNLAYSHALIEAGAVLQNLGLIASALNVGMHLRAGFDHARLHEVCHAGEVTLLISAVMGVKAGTKATDSTYNETLRIKMGWAASAVALPFHVATARVTFDDGVSMDCFGRSHDASLAYDKAMSEGLERYAMMRGPTPVVARWNELPNMIHPYAVLRWIDASFDETQRHDWIEFQNLANGQTHYILQDLCFYHSNHQKCGTSYCTVNTSGMACGPSRDTALTLATLELVERDAFMRTWLTGSSCQPLSMQMLDEDTRNLVSHFEAEGCCVVLGLLPSAWAVVVMVFVQHEQLGFTRVSAAADFDATSAASKAMSEVATGVVASLQGFVPTPIEVANVSMPVDHGHLYCQHGYFRQADFLIASRFEMKEALPAAMSHDLWHRMWRAGLHIYACEVALPQEREYLQGGHPVVCRVVIPGLIAMMFGSATFPLPEVVVPAWHKGEIPINRALVHPFS